MAESPQITHTDAGGFFPSHAALPSPAPSTASSRIAALLPHPRSRPLVPGSKKEDYARDYVARKLLHISRRYVKKFGIPDPADEVTGYGSMEEVCRDLEEVVDVLWFSGTPSLQIPYLLNVALAFNTYLPSFTPAPRPTFAFLRKLDHCFASLLVGYDVKSKDSLPGFSSAVDNSIQSRFSRTDMVRCKSLADETRMLVAMVMSGEVDVVDHVEDESTAQRPARAKSESRDEFVDVTNSTSPSPHGTGIVKDEEIKNVEEDFDFGDVDEETTIHPKRKFEESVEDVAVADQTCKPKRVKVEEEEDSSTSLSGIAPAEAGVSPPAANTLENVDNGQFHWALEDDDSDDDSNNEHRHSDFVTINQKTLSPLPSLPDFNVIKDGWRRTEDNDTNEGSEELGYEKGEEEEGEEEEEEEEEEEDEELQMNVGQVYEKTLVQLGKSLGQSILDD
ncbi:hypothetical protein GGS21DRAFT_487964 [Xylaria nigripes]|nr:hypothetical protein GGS21DRAFT_487964 [Xylaria nigripes]